MLCGRAANLQVGVVKAAWMIHAPRRAESLQLQASATKLHTETPAAPTSPRFTKPRSMSSANCTRSPPSLLGSWCPHECSQVLQPCRAFRVQCRVARRIFSALKGFGLRKFRIRVFGFGCKQGWQETFRGAFFRSVATRPSVSHSACGSPSPQSDLRVSGSL